MRSEDTSLPALFSPDLESRAPGETVRLDREEARHVRALRLADGAEVALIDGRGRRVRARLGTEDVGGRDVVLLGPLPVPAPLPVELCPAVGGKAHMLWLVEKATEVGVTAIQPLETRRSRSVADAARTASFWDKAGRRATAALKQSGGGWLPRFGPVRELETFLAGVADDEVGSLLLDRDGPPLGAVLADWDGRRALRLLCGPEGGLDPEERAACRAARVRPARLGPTTLRFETAALAALAVVSDLRERVTDVNRADGEEE
ncbi:MAG: RsmE family RNA methyltransferase [Gemmatimonadota bacterium]|nr:RsmE family RNA methyltransferase [Gemmatimonadota bacterium]